MDEDFILDRFNLTGLNNEVANYPQALDLITDNLGKSLLHYVAVLSTIRPTDDEIQDEMRGSLDVQARLLYGLIHARWIVTARGLQKMVYILLPFLRSSSLTLLARKIQTSGFWSLPSRPLLPPTPPPRRAHRRSLRKVRQALLWAL